MRTKALFYPTIEINNEDWLKANLLFWDEIHTIVPHGFDDPYINDTTRVLYEKELLVPEYVNPDHRAVRESANSIIEFFNTEEGLELLQSNNGLTRINRNKLGRELFNNMERIHPSKLAHELRYMLNDAMDEGWICVDSDFAGYYMTILANKICEDTGYTLLTDDPNCSNLSNKVKLGAKNRHTYLDKRLAQGIFINLIVESINFSPETKVANILSFKKDHQDELGLFRTHIKKLTKDIPTDLPINILKEEIEAIYNDEFLPSYNNLKKKLSSSGFKFVLENSLRVATYSIAPTSLLCYAGIAFPQALLAAAAASIVVSTISYNIDKKNTLRDNPYNYLYSLENN